MERHTRDLNGNMLMPKKNIWYKGNKDASKWKESEAEDIYKDIYKYVKDNESVVLKTELYVYSLENHGVSQQTLSNWRNVLYKDNICICNAWELIDNILESRVVRDQEVMRPSAQTLVLKNKHRYVDKTEVEQNTTITFADIAKQAEG